ncbi:EcoKI restriction-modification system protein HsdS [compost metagenome]
MENKHTPEIRFPGFIKDWEERKLGEGSIKIGDGLHGTPEYSSSGHIAFINGNNLVNGKIVINKNTKYVTSEQQSRDDKELNDNTILMSINGTIGNLAWYNGEKVMLGKSSAYIEVSSFDKKFMYQLLQTSRIRNYFLNNLTGTTIKNLGLKTIRETPSLVPTVDEQTQIGNFFKQLDDTLALHQQELTILEQTKLGFLQKMFPKEGGAVPEIRFPGFNGEWEERKLEELAYFSKGSGYSKSDLTDEGEPIILYGRLYTKYETVIDTVDTFVKVKENSLLSKGNEVIVPSSGETSEDISRASVVSRPGIILGGDLNIVQPINDIDPVFLAVTISNGTQQKELSRRAQGKSVVHLHNSDLKNVNLIYPEKDEQIKIGEFFKRFDDTIALHQRELDALKEIKKAFLQKMFI